MNFDVTIVIILGCHVLFKGCRICRMVNSIGFNLTSPAALDPNKRVSLLFEALKLGVDFSLAMKVLDDIFFQYKNDNTSVYNMVY